jgi:zinc ribbon protein
MDSTSTMEAPTTELTSPLATTSTDRCPNCGAQMAPDQRYCIQCGERRSGGGLRDALPRTQTAAPAAAATRQRPWLSPSSSLIAGVATLLLALGVGVLIGRSGDHGTRATAPQVVTVTAGAAGTAAAGGTTTGTTAASTGDTSKTSSKKKSKSSTAKAKVTGAASIDATAKKNGVKLPPKVVKVGQKCQAGAKGCQGGKFTGNFFGGG